MVSISILYLHQIYHEFLFHLYIRVETVGLRLNKTYEPAHDKTYNKTCATSEDSDQPAHPRSLIRVFVDPMCLLQPPGNSKINKRGLLPYWVDAQVDLSLCWLHMSYCRFYHALAHIIRSLTLNKC